MNRGRLDSVTVVTVRTLPCVWAPDLCFDRFGTLSRLDEPVEKVDVMRCSMCNQVRIWLKLKAW